MKRIAGLFAISLAMLMSSSRAHAGPFGLGLVAGTPSGLSLAYDLGHRTRLAGAVGLDLFDGRAFYVQGDFLFVLPDLLHGGSVGLKPYLGPGAFVSGIGKDRVGLGARLPFGLSLEFHSAPIEIFAELSAGLLLVPDVKGKIGGALGFRYYF